MAATALPEPITDGPLAGTHRWQFVVAETIAVTPRVRRLRLTADQLHLLEPAPGQDLMVRVADGDGAVNRRYSIRRYAAADERVDIDIVLHGHGPGAHWAATAAVGDVVEAVGPRGKIVPVAGARGHVFVGDAAGAPALLSMLEAVTGIVPAHALLLAADADEIQPTTAPDDQVTWLVSATLDDAAAQLTALAGIAGHVYLAAERSDVATLRAHLLGIGVPADAISAKAYWSRATPNAPHGEPPRDG
jgi:NADPH-dependent ferric siderophore reductase